MMNRVVLVGRLTRDPELRKTQSGMSVASFTIAIDNRQKGPNGEKTTSFIPCTVWGQSAENMSRFTKKGSLVGVDGRLNQRSYETKDNRKVQVIEVICDSVQFLESRRNDENSTITPAANYEEQIKQQSASDTNITSDSDLSGIDVVEDDLPF